MDHLAVYTLGMAVKVDKISIIMRTIFGDYLDFGNIA